VQILDDMPTLAFELLYMHSARSMNACLVGTPQRLWSSPRARPRWH